MLLLTPNQQGQSTEGKTQKRTSGDNSSWVSTGQMPFLSTNQQRRSTEENSKAPTPTSTREITQRASTLLTWQLIPNGRYTAQITLFPQLLIPLTYIQDPYEPSLQASPYWIFHTISSGMKGLGTFVFISVTWYTGS